MRSCAIQKSSPTWTRTVGGKPTENIVEVNGDDDGAAFSGAVGAVASGETATGAGGVEVPGARELVGKDAALRLLIEVWGELPDSVRNRILRLADDAVRVPG